MLAEKLRRAKNIEITVLVKCRGNSQGECPHAFYANGNVGSSCDLPITVVDPLEVIIPFTQSQGFWLHGIMWADLGIVVLLTMTAGL